MQPLIEKLKRLLSLSEIGRLLNKHPATFTRWINPGVRCRDGSRLKLKATRVGAAWYVDPADLEAFLNAHTATFDGPDDAPTVRAPAERSRAADAADAELAGAGW